MPRSCLFIAALAAVMLVCKQDERVSEAVGKLEALTVTVETLAFFESAAIPTGRSASSISDIYEPTFVGRPPSDAYIGLSRLRSGEIRHYDYGQQHTVTAKERGGESRRAKTCIVSRDNGLTWETKELPNDFFGADVQSPKSGEYVRLLGKSDGVYVARSQGGINGEWTLRKIHSDKFIMLKPPVFIRSGKRVLVCAHRRDKTGAGTFYSDDDGITWKLSNLIRTPDHQIGSRDKHTRWQNPGVEPTVVELKDGRIWMILRTSQDNHYESFSADGGQTWSDPRPSRFYGTLTMPTLHRLKDGRILFLWNNTTPMPQLPVDYPMKFGPNVSRGSKQRTAVLAFTNRDVLHAAISEDDGRTWIGFRELWLSEIRNKGDLDGRGGKDLSVHQTQVVEVADGKVLVSLGQHPDSRTLLVFDPDWLCERERYDDFSRGLKGWCVHQYIAKVVGHCRYNRKMGAELLPHPDNPAKQVLHIGRKEDQTLLVENGGATWNFPAGKSGKFRTRIMLSPGGQGGRISLIDRWFNPTDDTAHQFAMYSLSLSGDGKVSQDLKLTPGRWYDLEFEWRGLADMGMDFCQLSVDAEYRLRIPLNRKSLNGISYVHLMSTAESPDTEGFLIDHVRAVTGNE